MIDSGGVVDDTISLFIDFYKVTNLPFANQPLWRRDKFTEQMKKKTNIPSTSLS